MGRAGRRGRSGSGRGVALETAGAQPVAPASAYGPSPPDQTAHPSHATRAGGASVCVGLRIVRWYARLMVRERVGVPPGRRGNGPGG